MKHIPGFEGYAADVNGDIWSFKRPGEPRKLTTDFAKGGYLRVSLTNNHETKLYRVHRLVLLAYAGECPNGYEASHINGNRVDNRPCNLVWESRSNNHLRKWDHGTQQAGTQATCCKLSEVDVVSIFKRSRRGESGLALSREFSVNVQAIYDIIKGRTWTWLTGIPNTRKPRQQRRSNEQGV